MRDEFGEIDPDEVDVIDFIEPDASAFGADADDTAETEAGTDRRRRWLVPAAIVSAVGLAAVGVVAWAPWREDDTQSYPESATPELTLTEQLVFDHPPADLTAASLGQNSEEGFGFTSFSDAEGYFFAEPGVSWNIFGGQSTGRWAAFFATAPDSENAPDLSVADARTAGTVQGAPALIAQPENGMREITFGPVDGLIFSVVTSGMSLAESTAFAEAVGVDDDIPTIANETVLGDMNPIGDIADYSVALSTVFGSISVFGEQPGVVSVHYGDFLDDFGSDAYSIATQPVLSGSTMALLQFAFGGEEGKTVHGLPAVLIDGQDGAFAFGDGQFTSAVAWIEGGRLVVVAGPDDIAATLALAESVRPATEDEWAAVVEAARNSVDPSIPLFPDDGIDESTGVTVFEQVDQATGDTTSLTLEFFEGELIACIEEFSDGGGSVLCEPFLLELPILMTRTSQDGGEQFVIAIVDRGVGEVDSELRITLSDGSIDIYPLQDVWSELPGPTVATLLPEDHGAVELWIGAKLVKTLAV